MLQLSPQVYRFALWACWLAMFVGTHIPQELPGLKSGGFDKGVHLVAFGVLAMLFAINWELFGGRLTLRHYVISAVVLTMYGALDEWLQKFVHRDCNALDLLADIAGTVLGLILFHWLRPLILSRFVRHNVHSQ